MIPESTHALLHLRRLLIAVLHALLIAIAWYGSFSLRFDFDVPEPYRTAMWNTFPLVMVVKLVIFYAFGLFHGWWKYAGVNDLIDIAMAAFGGAVVCLVLTSTTMGLLGFPRSVFLLDGVLTFLFVGGIRFLVRAYAETFRTVSTNAPFKKVLIVGAGRTGAALVREMRANHTLGYEPVAFVDDDPNKQGVKLHGIPVRGTTRDIPALLKRLDVREVLLAIPDATGNEVRRIVEAAQATGAAFKIMPGISDLIGGRISVNRIREVRIEDLLGREVVAADLIKVRVNTEGHIIMVTGAAGSIGSELVRQIAALAPGHIVLFDRAESDLHDLDLALRQTLPNVQVSAVVGDILNAHELDAAFRQYRPSRVFHAAAYKHVWLMERHVASAIRNNVIGTLQVAVAAQRSGAEQMVLISTDKAVRPTSLMGATKRAAERVLLSMNGGQTKFTAVRFGNVLGSRGSVVPIFTRQIALGGPVTVTHPEVVRFFMTIPEAAQLVLQAAAASRGGDIFHLDMGEPVRIADLAANMIRLSGFEPDIDIEIKYVGLRPGEKLYEELLVDGEEVAPTDHPRVRVVRAVDSGVPAEWIAKVTAAAGRQDTSELLALIREAVPEYTPSDVARRTDLDRETGTKDLGGR